MHPAEALDEQRSLMDHLHSAVYIEYMTSFLRTFNIKNPSASLTDPKAWCSNEAIRLRMAYTYHVDKDMMPLLRWAADNLDGTDQFRRDMWPSEHGFLIFDTPWMQVDVWGKVLGTKAIVWGPCVDERRNQSGMVVTSYSDINDVNDDYSVQLKKVRDQEGNFLGRLEAQHYEVLWNGMRVGPSTVPISAEYAERLVSERPPPDRDMSPGPPAQESANSGRMILALIMLLGQTVTDTSAAEIPRTAVRRARRAQLPGRVTIIRLRRTEDSVRRVGETAVEWSHRWLVKGGWQWRHCSEDHPLAEEYPKGWHARVWVHSHLKGPADRPLVITDKVNTLVQ